MSFAAEPAPLAPRCVLRFGVLWNDGPKRTAEGVVLSRGAHPHSTAFIFACFGSEFSGTTGRSAPPQALSQAAAPTPMARWSYFDTEFEGMAMPTDITDIADIQVLPGLVVLRDWPQPNVS